MASWAWLDGAVGVCYVPDLMKLIYKELTLVDVLIVLAAVLIPLSAVMDVFLVTFLLKIFGLLYALVLVLAGFCALGYGGWRVLRFLFPRH